MIKFYAHIHIHIKEKSRLHCKKSSAIKTKIYNYIIDFLYHLQVLKTESLFVEIKNTYRSRTIVILITI